MQIRYENEQDTIAVQAVNGGTFGSDAEANLVAALREQAQPVISLVAEEEGSIVGHIMFSRVALEAHPELIIMGLAPMAVLPKHQQKGIGTALVHEGIKECKRLGYGAVVVLGHPDFYPRFGFQPSTRFAIRSEYPVPEELFMAMELQPDYLGNAAGAIKYHAAFSNL